jgi:hypothetical protein
MPKQCLDTEGYGLADFVFPVKTELQQVSVAFGMGLEVMKFRRECAFVCERWVDEIELRQFGRRSHIPDFTLFTRTDKRETLLS